MWDLMRPPEEVKVAEIVVVGMVEVQVGEMIEGGKVEEMMEVMMEEVKVEEMMEGVKVEEMMEEVKVEVRVEIKVEVVEQHLTLQDHDSVVEVVVFQRSRRPVEQR